MEQTEDRLLEIPSIEAPSASLADSEETRKLMVYRSAIRWALALLVTVSIVSLVVPWIPQVSSRPDLAQEKPWRASSTLVECQPEKFTCGGSRTAIFFHTKDEDQPWVEFDLGAPTRFTEIMVYNRRDGDQHVVDRAVPLILEVGDDRETWRTLGRQDESFSVWSPRFEPTTSRYVRLRSPRTTMLHLDAVKIYQ